MRQFTKKQMNFVQAYLTCGSATEAARQAGYRGSQSTLGKIAFVNLRKPGIMAAIKEVQEAVRVNTEITMERMSRTLAEIAFDGNCSASDRIAASREINRMYGFYLKDNEQLTPVVFNIGYDYEEDVEEDKWIEESKKHNKLIQQDGIDISDI